MKKEHYISENMFDLEDLMKRKPSPAVRPKKPNPWTGIKQKYWLTKELENQKPLTHATLPRPLTFKRKKPLAAGRVMRYT